MDDNDNTFYLVIYTPGPAWELRTPARSQAWQAHLDYLDAQQTGTSRQGAEAPRLLLEGYFPDDTGAVGLFFGLDLDALLDFIEGDPAVQHGFLQTEVRACMLRGGVLQERVRAVPRRQRRQQGSGHDPADDHRQDPSASV